MRSGQRRTVGYRYLLSGEIGEGAVATVWRAFDVVEDRRVAVKLLKDVLDPEDAARLQLEVSIVARLDHPNVIRFLDQGVTAQGQHYVVMELLSGHTLREKLIDEERIQLGETVEILRQVFSALYEAHRHRVVHRDVKPENVFLVGEDEGSVKLLDFGMAKVVGGSAPSLTISGHLFGTPHYMAPERIRGGDVRSAADIYSTGVMAYEMIHGERPFLGSTAEEIMKKHLRADPPAVRSDIPEKLGDLVTRCLAKEAGARPVAEEALVILECLKS
jgi:serine/threonine-protein kinase